MPYEGQTGTAPDGTRVVYRGGKVYPADQDPGRGGGGKLTPQEQTQLGDARAASVQALNTAQKAEQFMKVNKHHGTGWGMALPFVSDIAAAMSAPHGEMESITSQVAPSLRPPGSGSSSDKDVKFYRRGFPNLDFPGDTNQAITDRRRGDSDRAAAYSAFMDTWAQHRGSLMGGDEAFKQFWAKRQAGDPVANNVAPTKRLKFNPATGSLE